MRVSKTHAAIRSTASATAGLDLRRSVPGQDAACGSQAQTMLTVLTRRHKGRAVSVDGGDDPKVCGHPKIHFARLLVPIRAVCENGARVRSRHHLPGPKACSSSERTTPTVLACCLTSRHQPSYVLMHEDDPDA